MPLGLVRLQKDGDTHFITCSCHDRFPYFNTSDKRDLFEDALERVRVKYAMKVFAYVVMPEHVHLLVSEPLKGLIANAMKALKLSVTLRAQENPFWTKRYHDFNVFSEKKHIEKIKYIHRNPVTRELVEKPEDWKWSSYRHYSAVEKGMVEVDTSWLR